MKIPAGTILIFEAEIEAQYSSSEPYRVLRDFDQSQICAAFHRAWYGPDDSLSASKVSQEDFVDWLEQSGYIAVEPRAISWSLGGIEFNPAIEDEACHEGREA